MQTTVMLSLKAIIIPTRGSSPFFQRLEAGFTSWLCKYRWPFVCRWMVRRHDNTGVKMRTLRVEDNKDFYNGTRTVGCGSMRADNVAFVNLWQSQVHWAHVCDRLKEEINAFWGRQGYFIRERTNWAQEGKKAWRIFPAHPRNQFTGSSSPHNPLYSIYETSRPGLWEREKQLIWFWIFDVTIFSVAGFFLACAMFEKKSP